MTGHTERVTEDPADHDPLLDPPSWAPSWLPSIDDVVRVGRLRWLVVAVFAAGLGTCVLRGADAPADPELGTTAPPTTDAAGPAVLTDRFGTVVAHVMAESGEGLELCLLHADTAEERSRGLMAVDDLAGFDGMLFTHQADAESPFFMYRTVLPLTIAWWAGDGTFAGAADMAPCPADDPAECPRYGPDRPYRYALEVVSGAPVADAFAPGASLRVGDTSCSPVDA